MASRRRDPGSDYRAKVIGETARIARRAAKLGLPAPLGDPTSGLFVVFDPPPSPPVLDALSRSLDAVDHRDARVTWTSSSLLLEELLSAEPHALLAVGDRAASNIDGLDYPLARAAFSAATPGMWFSWTRGTAGLLLPDLAHALEEEEAKRRFWRAFLALRELPPVEVSAGRGTGG